MAVRGVSEEGDELPTDVWLLKGVRWERPETLAGVVAVVAVVEVVVTRTAGGVDGVMEVVEMGGASSTMVCRKLASTSSFPGV